MGTFPQENSLRFSHDRPHHVVYPGPPRTPTPAFKTIPSVDVLQLRTPSKLFLLFFFFWFVVVVVCLLPFCQPLNPVSGDATVTRTVSGLIRVLRNFSPHRGDITQYSHLVF